MIFLDSSLLVAYAVSGDSNHVNAVRVVDRIVSGEFGKAVTSDYVFDETVTVILARTKSVQKASETGKLIMESLELWRVDQSTFDYAWQIFRNQKTTRFSFTDCTIISQLEMNGIDNLGTFDREFEKTGIPSVIY